MQPRAVIYCSKHGATKKLAQCLAHKYNLPVILSSDAHQHKHEGMQIKEAAGYARSYGINEIVTFNKRKRIMEKL